jgi:ATP adenylyltransferase
MEYFFNFDKLAYLKAEKSDACILCLVVAGSDEVARLVVHETESFMVSLNLYPYNPGHLIVFPKRHLLDIRSLSSGERTELDALVSSCLDNLDRTMGPAGYNIGYNMGLAAGASIEHLHLHIIPRYQREIGIAELIAGSRVLVQDPRETLKILRSAFGHGLDEKDS